MKQIKVVAFSYQALAMLLLMSLGVGLRLFYLDNQSLWYDEFFQHWAARFPFPQLLEQVAADGQTPPLYYLITHFWLILGDWLVPGLVQGQPEFFLRWPSFVCAVLLLPVLYRLAYGLFGPKVALLALLGWTINPLLVGYGQEARAYSLALLLVALSFLLFLPVTNGKASFLQWLLYIIVWVAALYSHYYSGYVLVAHSLLFLGRWLQNYKQATAPLRELLKWFVAQLIIGLSFLPWLFICLGVIRYTSANLTVAPTNPLDLARRSFGWLGLGNVWISSDFSFDVPEDWPATLLMLSALLLLGLGTGLARQRGQGWAWMIGLAWFGFGSFGPALGGQVVKMATAPRYAIQGAPPLLLLLAVSLVWLVKPVSVPKKRLSFGLVGIMLILWSGLMGRGLFNYYFNPDYARPNWRETLAKVAVESQPQDLLLGFPYHHFDLAQQFYLNGREWPRRAGGWSFVESGTLYFPEQRWGGYADFGTPRLAPSSDLQGDLARLVAPYRRIWLIVYNDPTNAQVLNWLKANYAATPPRYFGPRQNLVLYRFE